MRWRLFGASLIVAIIGAACSDPEAAKLRHVQKADEHAASARYKEAILEYRNALKLDPRFGDARYKLADALLKDDRQVDAAREYVRAAELLPDRADVQLKAGAVLLSAREFQRAQRAGEAALQADPKSVDAQLLIAHAYAGLKETAAAIREIEEAIQLAPEDSRPYTSLGTLRLAEGDREKAAAAYRRAVELDPKSIPARLALALFHWRGDARDEAEAELRQAIAVDPKSVLVNRILALFYLTGGRDTDAEAPLLRLAEVDDPTAILTVADHFARTKRASDARAMYERLKAGRDTRTVAITRLARLDYETGRREQAHAALDEELKAEVVSADVAALKARFLLSENRFPDAEQFGKKAVESNPNSASAHYVLGLAQLARGQHEAATKSFNETLRINPRAGAAELQLSRLSLAAGNAEAALQRAEAARKLQPKNLQARLSVARALLSRRDLARAEAELKTLRREYPNTPAVHALYGGILNARSDVAGAAREYDRALQLDPTNLEALRSRVSLDVQQKKPADARARVARALAASPADAGLLVFSGRLEATLGDSTAAERQLRQAIEVNPAAFEAYNVLGQLYLRQKRLDEARAEFERLASFRANPAGAMTMVGVIYEIQNRPQDARRVYEEVVAQTNQAPVAANNLAWNYAQSGEKLDVALQLAQTAKQQLPDRHEVDDTLGWVYYKRNMPELAIRALEQAVKAADQMPDYHFHLGMAYAKAGRTDDAQRSLERALRLSANFSGADEARSALSALKR